MKILPVSLMLLGSSLLMADPEADLAGIQVVYDSAEKDFRFRTFNTNEAHNVALVVRSKAKPMVGFDEDKAEITIGGAKAKAGFFSSQMSFSDDKKSMKLEFRTNDKVQLNDKGELEVKGKLPVTLASTKAEIRSEVFLIKEGEAIVFPADQKGLPTLKIAKTGKPKYGNHEFSIDLSTNMKMDDFAGVKFLTKDGQDVKANKAGASWSTFGNVYSGTVEYGFSSKPEELILVIENWTDKEEKIIEVDLKASLAGK